MATIIKRGDKWWGQILGLAFNIYGNRETWSRDNVFEYVAIRKPHIIGNILNYP